MSTLSSINLYFVRHGQRIDHVDPSWVLTTPTPQDPPLTDLGKHQARLAGTTLQQLTLRGAMNGENDPMITAFQRMTPPESPEAEELSSQETEDHPPPTLQQQPQEQEQPVKKRPHHYAIVTSPFLRCTQTAIELSIGLGAATEAAAAVVGMKSKTWLHDPSSASVPSNTSTSTGNASRSPTDDIVTIAVEPGLAEWLSLEYVPEPVPESIIVQRMQEFAMARKEHEPYYSIDWKYTPSTRQLPSWPETREEMQPRLDNTLQHTLQFYSSLVAKNNVLGQERDLSIIFVTHASPVNALLESCMQRPILVPVPASSITRCRWTPLSAEDENDFTPLSASCLLSRDQRTQTIAGEPGRWTLDVQTYTRHLE